MTCYVLPSVVMINNNNNYYYYYPRSGIAVSRQVFTFICNSRTRGHSFKLFLPDSRVNCTHHFFAFRVLRIWNALPENVVLADHLSLFIRRLEREKLNQFLIGKMYTVSQKKTRHQTLAHNFPKC